MSCLLLFNYAITNVKPSRAHAQRRVIVDGWWFVGLFLRTYVFSRTVHCCRYQTWICGYVQQALGTAIVWSGVVQEQHVYGGGLKLIIILLGVHLIIRDRQPTAWDDCGRPAEAEATYIWKVSPQIVVERFLKVCIMHMSVK